MVTTTHTPQYRLENYEVEAILENAEIDTTWAFGFMINREKTYMQFWDRVDGTGYQRDYRALNKALNDLITNDRLPGWFLEELRYDDIQGDATVADMIIQWAAFGEVLYS